MPRAFLIKKHSPGKENAIKAKQLTGIEPRDVNDVSTSLEAETMDLSMSESKGPFDLSVKPKKFENELEPEEERNPSPVKRSPPSVIEFSPKIVTADYKTPYKIPPLIVPQISRATSQPSHVQKPVGSIDALNFHSVSNGRPAWSSLFSPLQFNYPYIGFPRPPTEYFNSPGPYLGGTALVSPPVMPRSTPRIELSPCIPPHIELSPCIPSESMFYDKPSRFHGPEIKDHKYLSPWDPKEGSTSPVSMSDSGESCPESAGNKYNSVVSSSTGSPVTCNQPPRYQCVDCNKSYATYSGLSRHRQFHCITQAKKAFNCKYCEKVYVSLGALKMHIRTHTLPCKCTICGKAFSRPWLLQGHIRTHTGEKPFACPHCSRAFADRSNLRAHLQTHSDIKKYSCSACSKTFSRMSLLLKHNDGGCVTTQGCPNIRYSSVTIQNC